ncbi:branched-chain amino acid ABC transporter permease [Paracoccus marinus]|uniref:branched-chain amino acid ABC transporter permease n=1 Tax=Paracoccus marinus TaxID=288426 RepID=UPI001C8F5094|nr:branched-chain amino acid ABC transporter permease [Paracoccus marinus]GLS79622.1 branched-chain amino acid ABC transporter permease [Paracoccus marinus]
MKTTWLGTALMGLIVGAMILVPFVWTGGEAANLVALILVWALFAIGFDLVFGTAGMLSFGHAALLGSGGYALAILTVAHGWGFMPALGMAALVGAAMAFGLSIFAVRVSGLFFSLLTLALAQMIYVLASTKLRGLTGGLDGIAGVPRPALFGIDLYDNDNFYVFIVVVFLIGLGLMALLRASPFGRSLRAVQANEVRAAQLGYNVQRLRQAAFVISGAYAGVAGSLLASLIFYISPQMLHWSVSGDVLIMTVLGGKGTLLGPVLGVAVFELLKEELSQYTQYWYGILGAVFIAATIFLPNGIAGLFAPRRDRDKGEGR